MRLAYLVHDLDDPAVARRLRMLAPHLDDAVVIGFFRAAEPPASVAGWPVVALGRTRDARLGRRVFSVLRARLLLRRLRPHLQGRDVVLSRQLETLPLAEAARRAFAPQAALAQECLDVHRMLLRRGWAGALLRRLEGWLLRRCALVLVSSPAFEREYLRPTHGAALPPVLLVENKVLAAEAAPQPATRAPGPPWRIGWYGVLRCRRGLLILAELTRRLPGLVEVELRGRPAASAIPDFDAVLARSPGLVFLGPYDRGQDLPAMYGRVHFAWAVDFFEAGANSRWLLPNRLYESALHGAVPIAEASVETGRWLARRQVGLLLPALPDAGLIDHLAACLSALTPAGHAALLAAVAAIPPDALVDAGGDGDRIAAALREFAPSSNIENKNN